MTRQSGISAIGSPVSLMTSAAGEIESDELKPERLPRGSGLPLATIDELAEQIKQTTDIEVAHQCAEEIRSLVSELLKRYEQQFTRGKP